MAKTQKRSKAKEAKAERVTRVPVYPIPFPQVMSRDELADKTDDQLAARVDALRVDMEYVAQCDSALSLQPWEVETAYTHRELGSRINRRQLHERYVAGIR